MTETPNPHIVDTDTLTGEMHPIRRVVVSLGSNLGERLASLQGAVNSLADTPDVWITEVSPVYETEPVDAPEGSRFAAGSPLGVVRGRRDQIDVSAGYAGVLAEWLVHDGDLVDAGDPIARLYPEVSS